MKEKKDILLEDKSQLQKIEYMSIEERLAQKKGKSNSETWGETTKPIQKYRYLSTWKYVDTGTKRLTIQLLGKESVCA